jgi:oxygen-dependent protoporphyrinogen oxidase
MTKSIAIVGAGIAGLTAANRLKKQGFRAVVFEALDRAGGRMYSVRRGDYLFDLGTIGLLGGTPILHELIAAARLGQNFSQSNALIAGFVRDGVAKLIDSAHPLRDFLPTDLLSTRSKLGLFKLVWDVVRHRGILNCENAIGLGGLDQGTVSEYAIARLNREAAEYLCSPLMRGIWFADSRRNSAAQLLWTLKQMAYPMYTLDCGNGGLPSALALQHEMRYCHKVTRVAENDEVIDLVWTDGAAEQSERFDACVIAVPPPLALKMAPGIDGARRQLFEAIRYTSVLTVHFGLRRRPANPETLLMFPEREANDIAAVYVNHNKAPGRAPAGKGSLSAYFTQDWSGQHFDMADDSLIELTYQRLLPHYGHFWADIEEGFVHRWPLFAISATPGIYRLMEEYQRSLQTHSPSRLQFAGDFMPNSGVNQAMSSGAGAAQRIAQVLGESRSLQ